MVYGKSSVTPDEDFSVKNSRIVGDWEVDFWFARDPEDD
jgi:hypothetical protein